jgi:hypothetical protein
MIDCNNFAMEFCGKNFHQAFRASKVCSEVESEQAMLPGYSNGRLFLFFTITLNQ